MANAFIMSNPYTFATIAVFNNVRRAYDGILAGMLSDRTQSPDVGPRTISVPDCEEALDLRAVINWTEDSPEGNPSRGGTCRQPMTQDDVKAYFRTADEGACLTFEDPQTKRQYELTYYEVC